MNARGNSSAGLVERWLTEPFERMGWRGIFQRSILAAAIGGISWAFVTMIIGGIAGRMSGTELLWAVVINECATVVAILFTFWVTGRDVARVEEWDAAGRPAAEASHMLRLVLGSPAKGANWGIGTYVVVGLPAIYAWFAASVEPAEFAIVLCVAGFLAATVLSWPVVVFTTELGTRPVIARIFAEFPHLSTREGPSISLRTRAILPVQAMTLSTGICVGGLSGLFDEPIEQIGAGIVVSLIFAGLTAMLLRFAVTESALRPVDDLIEGVERISSGDLGSLVPITSADEFAVLGRAVNEMTERLAAHDAEMRASRARIVAASDESRRRVERDLHDGAQQYLVLLELKLGLLTKAVADVPEASGLAAEIRADLARALAELRDLAHGIYPAVLESDGLPGALQAAAERASIPVTVDVDGVDRCRPEVEAAVYFCCLEALQNASKHAGAEANVDVRLARADGHLRFEVTDDGTGYDAASIGPSSGLQNMTDRIGAIGGELHIESEPGAGTTVRGSVPG